MSVGSNFAKAKGNIERSRSIAVLSLYSLMTPLGIFLGMILSSELQGPKAMYAESTTLAIASGSFIYLAFHEMSDEHASQESSSIEKLTLFSIGLIAMAALATSSS
jgi:zinc transporter 1/2/3